MKKIIAVVAVVLVFGGIMLYFSGEGKRNIKQAMAVGEKYKQAVYTMKYADIPQNMAEWDPFLEKRAEKFADRKSTRLNSSHWLQSRMPSSA